MVHLEQETLLFFFPTVCSMQETEKNPTDELLTKMKFQHFLNKAPHSSFKIFFILTLSLLQGLHTMSLMKSVLEGLKRQECKCTQLHEPPPIPYIPEKDEVQGEVAKLRNLQIKTSIEKDITLNFPVWHGNGSRGDFLMHVKAVLDTIKKRGHFKDYDKAQKAYDAAKKAVELAEAGLALINGTGARSKKYCKKKALAKAKENAKEALAKSQESESEPKEADKATKVTDNTMKVGFQEDLEKAKQAKEDAQGTMTAAASEMFAFYSNLLSPESRYVWIKIVSKQMESNPFVNLQGVSLEGLKGMSCKLFNNCVIFHLLTAFPINAAEQEKQYISNVLKKHQRVNVRQFVCHLGWEF
jgi:hypothetical protein